MAEKAPIVIGLGALGILGGVLALSARPAKAAAAPTPAPPTPTPSPTPTPTPTPSPIGGDLVTTKTFEQGHPISVLDLLDGIAASQGAGRLEGAFARVPLTVLPGTTGQLLIPIRTGWVGFMRDVHVYSDFYSPLITGFIFIDELTGTATPFAATQSIVVPKPSLRPIRTGILVQVTNATVAPPVAALITLDVNLCLVEMAMFDDTFLPILQRSLENMQQAYLGRSGRL